MLFTLQVDIVVVFMHLSLISVSEDIFCFGAFRPLHFSVQTDVVTTVSHECRAQLIKLTGNIH